MQQAEQANEEPVRVSRDNRAPQCTHRSDGAGDARDIRGETGEAQGRPVADGDQRLGIAAGDEQAVERDRGHGAARWVRQRRTATSPTISRPMHR